MDLDETMLRDRFDTAVADVTVNVVAIVGAGEEYGTRLRRRRRWQAGGSALAVLALVGGGFYLSGDLLDHRATAPAERVQLVPATPRGMAAAVIASVDLGTPIAVAGEPHQDDPDTGDTLQVATGYEVGAQKVEVDVIAITNVSQWNGVTCTEAASPGEETVSCDHSALPDGTPALLTLSRYVGKPGSDDPGTDYMALAAVRRDDQLVAVTEIIPSVDPSTAVTAGTLPIPMDVLLRVATDPQVGLSTTADLNAQGEDIKDFRNSLYSTSGLSGGVEVNPPSYSASPASPASPATRTGN